MGRILTVILFLLQRYLYNPLNELGVSHAGGLSLAHRTRARGDIGVGVDLNNIKPPRLILPHVYSSIAAAAEQAEDGKGGLSDIFSLFVCDFSRADYFSALKVEAIGLPLGGKGENSRHPLR